MIKDAFTNCEEKTQWLLRCDARFGVTSDSKVTRVWASHPTLYAEFLQMVDAFFSQTQYAADQHVHYNHAATFRRCVSQDDTFLNDIAQMSTRLFGWLLVTHVLRVTLYWWKHSRYDRHDTFTKFETLYQTVFDQDDRFTSTTDARSRVGFNMSRMQFIFAVPNTVSSEALFQFLSMTLPDTVDTNCFVVEATRLIFIVS